MRAAGSNVEPSFAYGWGGWVRKGVTGGQGRRIQGDSPKSFALTDTHRERDQDQDTQLITFYVL